MNTTKQHLTFAMFLDRLDAAAQQDAAYGKLLSKGQLTFDSAAAVATTRMQETLKKSWSNSEADFLSGLLDYPKYLPPLGSETDTDVQQLIESAKTDHYAFAVLKLAAETLVADEHLPSLRDIKPLLDLGFVEAPRRPTGQHRYAKLHRDTLIAGELKRLVAAGFTPMRAKATQVKAKKRSACDVMVAALETVRTSLSYDAVEAIWLKREQLNWPVILDQALKHLAGVSPASEH
ncbi:hypothetical protein FHG66_19890 [Rubellimicrobium rubrum]|uniref:Uncharacterized protein n=1 Tax=Rubellimicrobium rubrum TaxID=2585369 RepID=A0A5C4MKV8_9RHOB|nr:hypothetical protein [Rubellimicrobium rubrum]TNC45937.1 hypothetical protein FHG66_19890 [Rubellimicrobium rubrum]